MSCTYIHPDMIFDGSNDDLGQVIDPKGLPAIIKIKLSRMSKTEVRRKLKLTSAPGTKSDEEDKTEKYGIGNTGQVFFIKGREIHDNGTFGILRNTGYDYIHGEIDFL